MASAKVVEQPMAEKDPAMLTVLGVYTRDAVVDTAVDDGEKPDPSKKVMVRRRMKTKPMAGQIDDLFQKEKKSEEEDEYETAMVVPKQGLLGALFYHNDLDNHSDDEDSDDEEEEEDYPVYELNQQQRIFEERTILFQSYEHYQRLAQDPQLGTYFESMKQENNSANADFLDKESVLQDPRFGEQIIVSGLDARQLSVGDVFAFVDPNENDTGAKESPGLVVEVTSPRLACAEVDKRSSSPYGRRGVRRHANTHGLAGWFARVLQPGEVRDGMILKRIKNPHPKWTLAYLSMALYGECDIKYMNLGWAQWNRGKHELEELCSLKELGWYEWKDEAQWILDRWDKIQAEKQAKLDKKNGVQSPKPVPTPKALDSLKSKSLNPNVVSTIMIVVALLVSQKWETLIVLMNFVAGPSSAVKVFHNFSLDALKPSNVTFDDVLMDLSNISFSAINQSSVI